MVFDANLLTSAVIITTPILLTAIGELISERAGVLNIGLEGMMLAGAFFSFWAAHATGSLWLGILVGLAAGVSLAAIMALFAVDGGADQVIVGLGITILGTGITGYLSETIFASQSQTPLQTPSPLGIPLLKSIPIIGPALFDQRPLVYITAAVVVASVLLLYHTRWGLAIRAAGDLPDAVTANGLSVRSVRWAGTLTAGGLAGIGGAYLSIGQVGGFISGMTSGRGYLALAAVIFGGWRVRGVVAACFVFGGADALELRLQGLPSVPREVWAVLAAVLALYVVVHLIRRDRPEPMGAAILTAIAALSGLLVFCAITAPSVNVPSQLWLGLPYLLTLVALASVRSRAAVPRYLGLPYSLTADA